MKIVLMILLAIASLILIASVLLQSGNSAGLSGSIAGGAEQLFGKKKSKGYEALLEKVTAIGAVLFIVLSLVIVTME
ncbi:MAG: preprotein translocase subunit SecG [Clostridia bacterium]